MGEATLQGAKSHRPGCRPKRCRLPTPNIAEALREAESLGVHRAL
jgi:hypothetical protein